jgi:3'-phosphoadenosine 5'-phosphosulfate sulfotransferase (PAPS reductase)/FAD synthetase
MKLELPRTQPMLAPMAASGYTDIKDSLRSLYLDDPRPWLIGFSGGKDSTMLASLIVEVVVGSNNPSQISPLHMARALGTTESKHIEATDK